MTWASRSNPSSTRSWSAAARVVFVHRDRSWPSAVPRLRPGPPRPPPPRGQRHREEAGRRGRAEVVAAGRILAAEGAREQLVVAVPKVPLAEARDHEIL